MRTCFLLTTFFFLLAGIVIGQKDPMKFGKIDEADLKMTKYDKDTSANAVVLCEYAESKYVVIGNDFCIEMTIHERIKILNKNGFDRANVEISYYDALSQERIYGLKGATYIWENGKMEKYKLENSAIFDEKVSENYKRKRFTLPNIKEGCVIEYAYSVTSKRYFDIKDWYFQSSIPARWSEYRVSIPEYFYFNLTQKGFTSLAINEKNEQNETFHFGQHQTLNTTVTSYRWVAMDVPAFKSEPYMKPAENYLTKMEFELARFEIKGSVYKSFTETWADIIDGLLKDENFGLQLKRSGYLDEVVTKLKSENLSQGDLVKKAISTVQSKIKWNEKNGLFATNSLKKAWNEGSGNAADINLLLLVLLRELGFDANPVVLSTRSNGIIFPTHPKLSQLNYVIVSAKVNNKNILLDATDPLCPCGLLPNRCLNDQGKIVAEGNKLWAKLDSIGMYSKRTTSEIKFNDKGELAGKIAEVNVDYAAYYHRKSIKSENSIDKFVEKMQQEEKNIEISDYSATPIDSVNKPLICNFNVVVKNVSKGDIIYLNPFIYDRFDENPFKQETRAYPVDFSYSSNTTQSILIDIPEGYQVAEKPGNLIASLPKNAGRFSFAVNVMDKKIQVVYRLSINKTIFLQDEYQALRELYGKIVTKQNEQIVLKKI